MEHRSFETLHHMAAVTTSPPTHLDRDERLKRWAELLEREPNRRFPTLHRLEFALRSERPRLRENGSPLSVAAADPLLRASGLLDDTYGQARRFFGLSERQAHRLLCSCLNGPAVEGHRLTAMVRAMATPRQGRWFALVQTWQSALGYLRPARAAP